jgi:hypothetical protein
MVQLVVSGYSKQFVSQPHKKGALPFGQFFAAEKTFQRQSKHD